MLDQLIPRSGCLDQAIVSLLTPSEPVPLLLISSSLNHLVAGIHGHISKPGVRVAVQQIHSLQVQKDMDVLPQDFSTDPEPSDLHEALSDTESQDKGSAVIFQISLTPTIGTPLFQLPSQQSRSFLAALPTELHLLVFSHLDAIDSTCLGLASSQFYSLQQSLHGRVPLHARRKGPNPLEHAWEAVFAGKNGAWKQELGKQGCRHCGVLRCQLHMHLRTWVPGRYEYCVIGEVFRLRADDEEGGKKYCYRINPLKPGKCGRHPMEKLEGRRGEVEDAPL